MNEHHQEQNGGITSAEPKASWVRPDYCRFEAGAAELGDISNPDGGVNS